MLVAKQREPTWNWPTTHVPVGLQDCIVKVLDFLDTLAGTVTVGIIVEMRRKEGRICILQSLAGRAILDPKRRIYVPYTTPPNSSCE